MLQRSRIAPEAYVLAGSGIAAWAHVIGPGRYRAPDGTPLDDDIIAAAATGSTP